MPRERDRAEALSKAKKEILIAKKKQEQKQRKALEIKKLKEENYIDNFFEEIATDNSENKINTKEKVDEDIEEIDFAELFNLED